LNPARSENDKSFGLSAIGQIAVPVEDLDRAVAFYRDALGLRFLFQAPPGLAFFDCAGVRLMLDKVAEEKHRSSIIYFRVSDIREAHATLRNRGVTFQDEPHLIHKDVDYELWMAFFQDEDRNTLAIMSETAT
jgi:methylmalonyl-CoA/ethylmalonyl-CoA epimerase